jgi:hypothetical protein
MIQKVMLNYNDWSLLILCVLMTAARAAISPEESGTEGEESEEEEALPARRVTKGSGGQVGESTSVFRESVKYSECDQWVYGHIQSVTSGFIATYRV